MGGQWAPWPNHMVLMPSKRHVLRRSNPVEAFASPAITAVLISIKSPRKH